MDEEDDWLATAEEGERRELLTEVLLGAYERRRFQTELINEMPLYPTERLLWDEHQIPSVNYTGALFGPSSPTAVFIPGRRKSFEVGAEALLLQLELMTHHVRAPNLCTRLMISTCRSGKLILPPCACRGDMPGAAKAQSAVPDDPRLPPAQLQSVPAGGDVRDS